MLAMSPLFSSNGLWPFEDSLTYHHDDEQMMSLHHHDQYNYHQKPPCNEAVDNYYSAPAPQKAAAAADTFHAHENDNNSIYGMDDDEQLYSSPQSASINVGVDNIVTRKQNHNASERDRRKKINDLYTSLRDLLPRSGHHHTKKISIPETVSRALKYVPELQQEVETLIKKKAKLSRNIFGISLNSGGRLNDEELMNRRKRRRIGVVAHDDQDQQESGSSSVSANLLGENEIVLQISTLKYFDHSNQPVDISQVLMQLENDGFNVLSVSSCESFGGRIFYNVHLWAEGANATKCGWLSDKILSLYEN